MVLRLGGLFGFPSPMFPTWPRINIGSPVNFPNSHCCTPEEAAEPVSFKLKAGKGMMPPDGADVSQGETSEEDEVKQTNGPKE